MSTKVYSITHKPTGKQYIGTTDKTVFTRWAQHHSDLRCGKHTSKALQALWNGSVIEDWCFDVLKSYAEPLRNKLRLSEEKRFMDMAGDLCLNDRTHISSLDRWDRVASMLAAGSKNMEVAAACGLSSGMVSRIKIERFGYGRLQLATKN